MNETMSQTTTEWVLRRTEEPLRIFGMTLPPGAWFGALIIVLLIGFFYVAWMYVRDSKSIGGWWATFLGALRAAVYIVLALVFLMPAKQTWYESRQRSKVVLLWDVSLSMSTTRDDIPPPGKTFDQMPRRMDKVFDLLSDSKINFIPRLEDKNPLSDYRFSRGLDNDYRFHEGGRFWPRAEREKALLLSGRHETPPPGFVLEQAHWKSWLMPTAETLPEQWTKTWGLPTAKELLPPDWNASDPRTVEFLRQARDNGTKINSHFYEATAIGESLLEVIKHERNNMVEGIVVFTDGRLTEGSMSSVREAALAAKDAEIPIFVVQVGEARPKVTIDIVDIGAPPLIRPEDKFRVIVTVGGQDMQPNVDTFDIALEVSRFKRKPNSKEIENLPLELVELDEKGQVLADKKIPLKVSKVSFRTADAKEKPVFKPGTPPTCQVEFELDATKIAMAAGVDLMGQKVGLAPDDGSEIRFVARIPKDKREITDKKEHESDAADMRVEEKALRVLLLTSAATRDYQYVRALLVREEQKGRAKVCIHLQQIPDGEKRSGIVQDVDAKQMLDSFPVRRTLQKGDADPFNSLAAYDVIVAFDYNWGSIGPREGISNTEGISREQADALHEWVYKKGGGLIFVAGSTHTKDTVANPVNLTEKLKANELKHPSHVVADMLPVVLEYGNKNELSVDTPRRLLFPQATPDMEFMRLDETLPKEKWLDGWNRFFNDIQDEDGKTVESKSDGTEPERGIFSVFPSESVKGHALRIATIKPNPGEDPTKLQMVKGKPGDTQPFLATGPWGEGKVIYIASGETWRLRMFKEQYHERFWTKLLREAGSKSANTLNKRITTIMSRTGIVNRYQPFEARFEDLEGFPLRRSAKMKPKLIVSPPEGVPPEIGNKVTIKVGEHANKIGTVREVINERDGGGATTRRVKLAIDADKKETAIVTIDSRSVEIAYEPILFKPKLGEKNPDDRVLEKNNDGWFKVEFQPRSAGEYKLKVVYEDSPDNDYNHKFIVKDSNPELDNVKPDPEVLWEMASPALKVMSRIENETLRTTIRKVLREKPKTEQDKDAEPGKKPAAAGDEGARLLFDLRSAEYIPDCMTTQKKETRNRGRIDDLWDTGFIEVETESGEKKPLLPHVLWVVVGLLSIEWLTRKLLRLA